MTRASFLTAAVTVALAIGGCGDNFESPDPDTLVTNPTTVSLQIGETSDVGAMFMKDGAAFTSDDVTWDTSDARHATVDGHGNTATITATGSGTATITATSSKLPVTGATLLAKIVVTVAPAMATQIAISPSNPFVASGVIVPVHVTALLQDGSLVEVTNDVVWTSSQPLSATVTGSQLKGLVPGDATITAVYQTKYSSTDVTITAAVARSISVTPVASTITAGATLQYTAVEKLTDGSTKDATTSVTWASTTTATATIASTGLATAVAAGTTSITATLGTVVGTTALTVTP